MPSPAHREQPHIGVLFRIASATAFALMAALLKLASGRGVSTPEMIFYRNVWALPVVASWISLSPGWAAVQSRQPLAHLTRSGLGLVSMLLTFGALALLPLGEATTLTYAAPIFATILSALLLREAIGPRRWGAVATGFVGVLLVVHPGGAKLPILGVLIGIGAALGQSAVMITLRTMAKTESIAAIVFWFTLLTTIAGAALLPFFGHGHDRATYTLLAAAGLMGGVGQLTMTSSLRHAPVSVVVPFDYLQIVWATLFGWVAFATKPTATTLAGAALIAGGGIYTAYCEHRRGREPSQAHAVPEG